MKRGSTSQTLTATTSTSASQDARNLLVRETLRISANLASESTTTSREQTTATTFVNDQFVDASFRLICYEEIDGRRFKYLANHDVNKFRKTSNSIRAVSLQSRQAPVDVS